MTTQRLDARWGTALGWGAAGLWVVAYLGARLALGRELAIGPAWVRVVTALVPIVPSVLFLFVIVSSIRGLDELHRRVHLEALAIAFPLAILLLMTLGLLELAVGLNPEDWSYRHVWQLLPVLYFLSLGLAWRRYW